MKEEELKAMRLSELIVLNNFLIERKVFHERAMLPDEAKYFSDASNVLYPIIYKKVHSIFDK